jgi:hypothetical protein
MTITGWSAWPTNPAVLMATVSKRIENLYVDGKLLRIARYPNTGWLFTASCDSVSRVVTCPTLMQNPRNAAGYWNNCRMRWRHWSWYYDTRMISGYAANGTLTLAGSPVNSTGNNGTGWGFYLDGKLSELDTVGEWFYDSTTSRVYVYPPAGMTLSTALVEGAWDAKGGTASNALVENICFKHWTKTGLEVTRATTVRGCRFESIGSDSGGAGISVTWNAQGVGIRNCRFENNLNLAVSWVQNPANTGTPSYIEQDTFVNIGAVPGYGGKGPWHAAGIIISVGKNVHIQYNVFDTTGYAAVILGRPGNVVEYNVIRNAMATLNDGAGIYTNCDSSTIRHNIVLNSVGDWTSVTSGWKYSLGHGIWPEFLSHFKYNIIDSNTCAGCNGNGIFFPNNFNSTIRGNVLYGNLGKGQIHIEGGFYTDDNLPLSDTITGNVFYATAAAGHALTYRPEYNYGLLARNWYCNPLSSNVIGQYTVAGWTVNARTLPWWQTNWTQADAQAKTDIIKRPTSPTNQRGISRLVINDQPVSRSMPLDDGIYLTLDSTEVKGSVNLAPYSSMVLVHTGQVVGINDRVKRTEPMADWLEITPDGIWCNVPQWREFKLTVYDLKGSIVRQNNGTTNGFISTQELGTGLFIAQVTTLDGQLARKITIIE